MKSGNHLDWFIGIDPGISGHIAVINGLGDIIAATPMPTAKVGKANRVNPQALAGWLVEFDSARMCFVEQVGAMPGQGVSSMFSFGHSAGIIEGVVAALQIPITLVPPAAWKKSQGLVGKDKDAARTRAAQLYPRERTFDLKGKGQALADAVFIARHGAGIQHAQ